MPPRRSKVAPQLWGTVSTDPNDVKMLQLGVDHGHPYHLAEQFVGLGTGSAPTG